MPVGGFASSAEDHPFGVGKSMVTEPKVESMSAPMRPWILPLLLSQCHRGV